MTRKYLFYSIIYILISLLSIEAQSESSQEAPSNGFLKRELSLSKPYSGTGMNMPFWDFRDNVFLTNNFVRLTSNRQSQRGSLWNKFPCHLRDWEFQVNFKIHGGGRTLAADGMAIWYTKHKMNDGPIFGSADNFVGLGVFLDTYKNGNQGVTFPQVSAMIGNGSYEYDHANDGKKYAIGSCSASFRNQEHDTVIAIRYAREKLTINLDVDGLGIWRNCLTVDGVTLPTGYYFGVSAATGDLADNHDVVGMKFYQLDVDRSQKELSEDWSVVQPGVDGSKLDMGGTEVDEEKEKSSGFKIFFIVLCVIIVLCLCAIGGLFVLKKRQEENRKRFY